MSKLNQFKKEITKDPNAKINAWDMSYYGPLYSNKHFHLKKEVI